MLCVPQNNCFLVTKNSQALTKVSCELTRVEWLNYNQEGAWIAGHSKNRKETKESFMKKWLNQKLENSLGNEDSHNPIGKNLLIYYRRKRNHRHKLKTLHHMYPKEYDKYAKLPVEEDKVVIVENRFSELTNTFKVLFDELAGNYNFRVHCHFVRTTYGSVTERQERCMDLMRDMATAKYVFLAEASDIVSCVNMRPETIVTQLWHGCGAFKKFGLSTADLLFGSTREEFETFPVYGNYDHVIVSSPEVSWAYEEAMGLQDRPEVIKATGSSRTDIFFDESFQKSAFEKLHQLMPESEGKKVILYAPTFRGKAGKAKMPDMLRVDMFADAFAQEYVLLMKYHPLVANVPVIAPEYQGFARDLTQTMSIEELLCVADVCISDYSSLVFEYSLFERPMLFYAFDLDEYFDWRGFYYDYYDLTPGPVVTTNREMIDYIVNIEERFDKQRVVDFRKKFMECCDGHATERIMKMVFGDALKTYKKEQPVPGVYHDIPQAWPTHSQRESVIQDISWWSSQGAKQYAQAVKDFSVIPRKVALLTTTSLNGQQKQIAKRLEQTDGIDFIKLNPKTKDRNVLLRELAVCEYILLTGNYEVMNGLDIRPETTVIQLWHEVVPTKKFGYSSREAVGGLMLDYMRVAPFHRNYQIVTTASDQMNEVYVEAFGLKEESACRAIGAPETDLMLNDDYRKAARTKLEKVFPALKNKKLIFYRPEKRFSLIDSTKPIFLDYGLMNEYLKDDYFILFDWQDADFAETDLNYPYYAGFIGQRPSKITITECMAAADVMIGDYDSALCTFAVTGRPTLVYAPDIRWYRYNNEFFYPVDEMLCGPVYEDMQALIDQLQHMDTYDDTKRQAFADRFLSACDGHTMDRLVRLLLGETV